MKYTLPDRAVRVMMKLVVQKASGRVVGCHMLGPDAAEIVQSLAVAVKLGVTKKQMDATMAVHPTIAEEFVTMASKAEVKAKPSAKL